MGGSHGCWVGSTEQPATGVCQNCGDTCWALADSRSVCGVSQVDDNRPDVERWVCRRVARGWEVRGMEVQVEVRRCAPAVRRQGPHKASKLAERGA